MESRAFIGMILVIGMILIAGCARDTTPPAKLTCEQKGGGYETIDRCYLEEANQSHYYAISSCEKISGEALKDSCLAGYFIANREAINCSAMAPGYQDLCNKVMGKEKISVTYCDQIISLDVRDDCYDSIALLNSYPYEQEKQICNKIYDNNRRSGCLAFVELNGK